MTHRVKVIHVQTGHGVQIDSDTADAWVRSGVYAYPEMADPPDRVEDSRGYPRHHEIENPSYYEIAPGVSIIHFLKHLEYVPGNICKYIVRAGKKPGNSKLQDLLKARRYLDEMIKDAASEDAAMWTPDVLEDK